MPIVRPNTAQLFGLATRGQANVQPVSGGGGGGAYVAKAVHFDGSAMLHDGASLTGLTDVTKFLFSVWINVGTFDSFPSIAASYPNNSFDPFLDSNSGFFGMQLADYQFDQDIAPESATAVANTGWQNIVFSGDTSADDPGKVVQIYVNGSPSLTYTPGSVSGFSVGFDEETDFYVGWDGFALNKFTGDMSDLQLWCGINPDLSNSTVLNKLISGGKPVDPATATAAFGAQVLLFSGDATGFVTNQGTGGTFTLSGSLANASTSPSD